MALLEKIGHILKSDITKEFKLKMSKARKGIPNPKLSKVKKGVPNPSASKRQKDKIRRIGNKEKRSKKKHFFDLFYK